MEKGKDPNKKWTAKCSDCGWSTALKSQFILHLLGKKHQRKVKQRNPFKILDMKEKTVTVGVKGSISIGEILEFFIQYGISSASHVGTTILVEFMTLEAAQEVVKEKHFTVKNASLTVQPLKPKEEGKPIFISQDLLSRLSQPATGNELNALVDNLIKEIELQPWEYDQRECIRRGIVNYFSAFFSTVDGVIFGSSANNLGFTGCDIDMYLDVGVYPWLECETESQARKEAKDLTKFLAKKIRQSGKASRVQPIPNARVPIVKFQDRSSNILVDISFRNALAVHNTRLIYQYARTHPLVRPYLMVIRYWAKKQGISGGGRPTTLITNYALTMMMIFYLMYRSDPIVPSVSYLRSSQPDYTPSFIGPWDVSFGNDVSKWFNRFHNVSVMALVAEFFSFFGELDASKWVVCPLVGMLLDRHDIAAKSTNLPKCLDTYLQLYDELKLDAPLHVQDPFEHCHNITNALNVISLFEFQFKCIEATEIAKNIIIGEQALKDLFQPIQVRAKMMAQVNKKPPEKDKCHNTITLGKSDASQDIKVVNSPKTEGKNAQIMTKSEKSEKAPDVEIVGTLGKRVEEVMLDLSDDDIEVLSSHDRLDTKQSSENATLPLRNGSASQTGSVINLSADNNQTCNKRKDSSIALYPVVVNQLNKCSLFSLNYSDVPKFSITLDGELSHTIEKQFFESLEVGEAACELVKFVLIHCLKVELTTQESCPNEIMRKTLLEEEDNISPKRVKTDDGHSAQSTRYLKISKYKCIATTAMWKGRKKAYKTVAKKKGETPLQYEVAVTEAQIKINEDLSLYQNAKFEFTVEVWQELVDHYSIHIGVATHQGTKGYQTQMINMFSFFSPLCKNLFKTLTNFVRNKMH